MNNSNKILVAQLGARTHYAVPQILYQQNMLEHFYTDICATQGWPKYFRLIPKVLQPKAIARLTGRVPRHLPDKIITGFSNFGFEYVRRLRQAKSNVEIVKTYLWAGETFGKLILKQGLTGTGVYTFNTAGFLILQEAKKQGIKAITEQTIAPYQIEHQLLQKERELYPDWECFFEKSQYHQELIERENLEWESSDLIICGSNFVKESIQKCNPHIEDKKFSVIPYGVSGQFKPFIKKRKQANKRPLRVLTVGNVGLRKGSPYVLETAKKLQGKAVFRMVGSIEVSFSVKVSLQNYLELIGQVPRTKIKEHFDWADIFLLPSICEGSATVIYEALACGLPVITTLNAGSIVRDSIDGYIVPIRHIDSMVERIELLIAQPEKLAEMSNNAAQRSIYGNLHSYGARLIKAIS